MSDQKAFADKVLKAVWARRDDLELLPAAIVVAHAAFESGWGTSAPARLANNIFNITRPAFTRLPTYESGDLEYDTRGNVKKITQQFAKYKSLDEGVEHYFEFIDGKRYRASLQPLTRGDFVGFISKLREGGYFTLPLLEYLNRMSPVLGQVCTYIMGDDE